MEMQRGPRGLRDREYPEDVQGHIDPAGESDESPAEAPQADASQDVEGHVVYHALGEDEDDVQGHVVHQVIAEDIDGRER